MAESEVFLNQSRRNQYFAYLEDTSVAAASENFIYKIALALKPLMTSYKTHVIEIDYSYSHHDVLFSNDAFRGASALSNDCLNRVVRKRIVTHAEDN